MQIIKINNPFQRQDRDIEVLEFIGQTVEELLLLHLKDLKDKYGIVIHYVDAKERIQISINGLIIPSGFWDTSKPQQDDQIVFMPVVGKGGSDKQILNAVIMIAVMIVAGPQSAFITSTLGLSGTAAILASAAIIVGTGMLIQSLTPSPRMGTPPDWNSSQIWGWSPHTTQEEGLVVPKFYGRNRLYGNVIAVHTEIDDSDDTKQNLKMLASLGEGPVQGIVDGTIRINDQPVDNFSEIVVEEKLGTIDQTAISFFTDTKPEYRPNRIVTAVDGGIVYTTPDDDFDGLEIELMFDRGIYFANAQGSLSSHSIGIKIEISVAGEESWDILVVEAISDNVTSPKRVSYTTGVSYPGGSSPTVTNGNKYDIKVTKTSIDETSSRYGDRVRLGSVREIISDDFTYPKTALLGISALATDQLSGSLSVSCEQEGAIVAVYDGDVWDLEYSNNPAWVLWDILTQPVISGDDSSAGEAYTVERYDGIDPSRLDLPMFYALAQFCDQADISDGEGGTEKRVTFNGGFDIGVSVWEAALKVCEIARCSLFWNGVEVTLAIDRVGDPVQMFTVANITRDSFKETFLPQSELASEIEIHYRDAAQDYRRVPFTIVDPSIANTTSRITLELFGITKQSEAWRAGMLRLAQNRYLKSTVEFDVDIDAIACTIGDIIYVQHDVPLWGIAGRAVSGTTLSIIVDKDLEYSDASGYVYEVFVRKADDTINERICTSQYNGIIGVDQGNKQFEISNDFSDEYKQGDRIRVVDSTGNDGIYTLDSDAEGDSAGTVITVVEAIPDATVDGGLYNLRRVVVSLAFKNASNEAEAPAADDVYSFGVQNLQAREYRIIGLKKTSDQYITITAIEYNELIYGPDSDTPIIPISDYTSPASEGSLSKPPSKQDLWDIYPPSTIGAILTIDIPLTTNLTWNSDDPDGDSVSWSRTDLDSAGGTPIIFTIHGVAYQVTAGNTNKKYVYWDPDSPTVFLTTDVLATAIAVGNWVMCFNGAGTVFAVWGRPVIHGSIIQTGTITADLGQIAVAAIGTANIINLNVTTAKIANMATTIFGSAFDNTPNNISESSEELIEVENFPTEGGVVKIEMQAFLYNTGVTGQPGEVELKFKRGSTILETWNVELAIKDTPGDSVMFQATFYDSEQSGTPDYSLWAEDLDVPYEIYATTMTMTVTEILK